MTRPRIRTSAFGSGPTEGTFEALLSTGGLTVPDSSLESFLGLARGSLDRLGNGDATSGSAIRQTFTGRAGDILTFDWNFLTNEFTPESLFNDFSFVSLGLLSELADTRFPIFLGSPTPFNEETGFRTFSFTIPTTGTYVLGLGVTDVEDTTVDSGLLVDNVRLTPVPEPTSTLGVLAFGAFGASSLLKRKRQQKA